MEVLQTVMTASTSRRFILVLPCASAPSGTSVMALCSSGNAPLHPAISIEEEFASVYRLSWISGDGGACDVDIRVRHGDD